MTEGDKRKGGQWCSERFLKVETRLWVSFLSRALKLTEANSTWWLRIRASLFSPLPWTWLHFQEHWRQDLPSGKSQRQFQPILSFHIWGPTLLGIKIYAAVNTEILELSSSRISVSGLPAQVILLASYIHRCYICGFQYLQIKQNSKRKITSTLSMYSHCPSP